MQPEPTSGKNPPTEQPPAPDDVPQAPTTPPAPATNPQLAADMAQLLGETTPVTPPPSPVATPDAIVGPASTPSGAPFQLPIAAPEKHGKKRLIIIITAVIMVLGAAGAAAYVFVTNEQKQQSSGTDTKSSTTLEAIGRIPAVDLSKLPAAPPGWKQFVSKKFGISVNVPKAWFIQEFDPQALNSGAHGIYGDKVNFSGPDDHSGGQGINVTRAKLADTIKATSDSFTDGGEYTIKTKAMKWQGFDAVEMTRSFYSSDDKKEVSYLSLYVQISDYVFDIPDRDDTPRGIVDGNLDKVLYQQVVDSIRVDAKVVEAQAKVDSQPVVLPTGKDVNLPTTVTVPAGWKKVTSKYGLSYLTKNDWTEDEQSKGLSGGALYFLTVESSGTIDTKAYMTIGVYSSGLDEITNQSAYMAGAFGGGVSSVTQKMKWNGHDARRIVATQGGKTNSSLYVQVGKYVYELPDPASDTQSGMEHGKLDDATYKTYIESIRIAQQ